MKCPKPLLLKKGTEHEMKLPCGTCAICKEERLKEWYVRLLAELGERKTASFITLTYDDNHLPFDLSLKEKDVQLFLMRLRYNTQKILKYFYCGEYGEKNKRAHYHIIMFGDVEKKEIQKAWNKGMIDIGEVNSKSIRYVLNYTQKDQTEKIGYYRVKKPFQRMSKGLGLDYLIKNEKNIAEKGYIEIQGHKYKIPRYYHKKSLLIQKSFNDKMHTQENITNYSTRRDIPQLSQIKQIIHQKEKSLEQSLINQESLNKIRKIKRFL